MINIDKVSKSYGKDQVLDEVGLSIDQGKFTAFIGPNGAGKSTTMKMLLGLTAPTDGEFQIDNLTFPNDRVQILKKRRRRCFDKQDHLSGHGMRA